MPRKLALRASRHGDGSIPRILALPAAYPLKEPVASLKLRRTWVPGSLCPCRRATGGQAASGTLADCVFASGSLEKKEGPRSCDHQSHPFSSVLPSVCSVWLDSVLRQAQSVYLPPAAGATPLSAEIHAQASYLVGMGYFVESAAMARKIHAEAASIEIDNWVKYTKAYWERKGIWEREWHKRHPSPVERQQAVWTSFGTRSSATRTGRENCTAR